MLPSGAWRPGACVPDLTEEGGEDEALDVQRGLRNLIERVKRLGCPVPSEAEYWADQPVPQAPRRWWWAE